MRSTITNVIIAVTLLFGAAAFTAEAQAPHKIPRIGYLSLGAAVIPEVFLQRLRELGYSDKQNFVIDYRFGEGRHDAMTGLARELVDLHVDVIMAFGDQAIVAAQRVTSTIPIVMYACDALTVGFVASLARPGGNVTGVTCVTTELSPKRVELLREAIPKVARVGLLFNPANVAKPFDADRTRLAAQGIGMTIQTQEVLERADLDRAFAAFGRQGAEAVIVLDEALMFIHAKRVAELALRYRLPTMHAWRESVVAGGLMSYGPSSIDMLRAAAAYVEKILKGAKPGELPIEQPTKFELVINLKTAKALGLTIPPPRCCCAQIRSLSNHRLPNNAFHLTAALAFARPPAGECERWADRAYDTTVVTGGPSSVTINRPIGRTS